MDSSAAHPPVDAGDMDRVIAALDQLLPAEPTQWPGGYPGQVELALIDAIVSIRTRYGQPHNGVRGQVALWRTHRGGPADNLRVLAASDPTQVLSNKQHLAGGLTKPQAIQGAAAALVGRGIITAADVLARPDQARAAYTGVTGLSTVTFDYFLMLLGTETVKPDTWVLRYLHQVLDRPVSTGEASALLTNAAHRMGRSPREVDHQVWLHMRQTTAASPSGTGVATRQPAPAALELSSATVGHLIDWRSQIDAELTRRNMVRTRGPVTGELMERVVADAYQAPLTEPATKSVDMIHPDGRTIQVKTRTLAGDHGRRFAFTTIDADLTVVIMLDPVTNTIQWAREIPAAELRPLLTPYEKEWRLPPGRAQHAGTDITQRLRRAHEALQAQ